MSVAAVRRFNRLYTKHIGALGDQYLSSPFTLTEARTLYELAQHQPTNASDLSKNLELDTGYLSRILRGFVARGLLRRERARHDGRQQVLSLTEAGMEAFGALDAGSDAQVNAMLDRLSNPDQRALAGAMATIEHILGGAEPRVPYLLRPHRPGDMGWVVHSHGATYAQEYGFDEQFEALVAEIVAKFLRNFDPKRERCWIAEREGRNVGSVFLVKHSATVAKLRLLLVDPRARGLGIGSRLVEECIRSARECGYRKLILWTQSILLDARRIYERAGFRLIREEPHHSFGEHLIGETWELRL